MGVRGLIKPLRGMERGNNHPVISSLLSLLLFVFLSLRSASFPTKPGRKSLPRSLLYYRHTLSLPNAVLMDVLLDSNCHSEPRSIFLGKTGFD